MELKLSPAEFGVLKMSGNPDVREKHYNIYANSCKANAQKVLDMVKLRRDLAL